VGNTRPASVSRPSRCRSSRSSRGCSHVQGNHLLDGEDVFGRDPHKLVEAIGGTVTYLKRC